MNLFSYFTIAEIKILDISTTNLIDSSFLFEPVIMILAWVLIFSSDWLMNYWGAKLYFKQAKKFHIFEQDYTPKHLTLKKLNRPDLILLRYFSDEKKQFLNKRLKPKNP